MTSRGPVVGIVGNDVPRQLVLAAGAMPCRLTGSWRGPVDAQAAQLLGAADAAAARILTELRAGSAGCDALVVCADSQAHVRLFYVLRATAPQLPLHLLDLPRADSAPARRFARVQLESLAEFLSDATGRAIEGDALITAAAAEQALHDARVRLRERRRADPPLCGGALALEALLAAGRLEPAEAVARLDAARSDVPAAAVRVHVTGSAHPDASLYRVMEEEQTFVVVSEDHDTGDEALLGGAVDSDRLDVVLDGLTDLHFARVGGSAAASCAARARLTRDSAVAAGAQLVVGMIRELDEAPAWDVADQSALLSAIGVPFRVSTGVPVGGEAEAAHDLVAGRWAA